MSNRPDNVCCETCVLWVDFRKDTHAHIPGACRRFPDTNTNIGPEGFCGEWRDGWPREIIYIPPADSSPPADSFLLPARAEMLSTNALSKRIAVGRALLDAMEATYVKKTAPS